MKKDIDDKGNGPKYYINIEGEKHPWDKDTITTEEIIQLGGWDPSMGAIVIDLKTNIERTLSPGEVVEIKPGQGFAKKVRFKRGYVATERLQQELELLRSYYDEVEYVETGEWVLIRNYVLPSSPPWNKKKMDVCFQIPPAYPGAPPYGFYVPSNLRCAENPPSNNYKADPPAKPPFEGGWGFFSWSVDSVWRATADLKTGANIMNFVRTFEDRLKQGV